MDFWNIGVWGFGILLLVIGVLNIIFVHFVPGLIYMALSCMYLPPIKTWLKKRFGFSVPRPIKIILGVLIMWVTLGVGDLMELFEAQVLH